MKNIVSATQGQAGFSSLLKQSKAQGIVPVSKNGRLEAFMVSRDKMAAILETIELQKDTSLMALIRQDQAGKLAYQEVPDAL